MTRKAEKILTRWLTLFAPKTSCQTRMVPPKS
jgi:hypothetical protein